MKGFSYLRYSEDTITYVETHIRTCILHAIYALRVVMIMRAGVLRQDASEQFLVYSSRTLLTGFVDEHYF